MAVRSGVAARAPTPMRVAKVLARPVMAEVLRVHALPCGRILARYHLHVAQLARPAGGARAMVRVFLLRAGGTVFARILRAPVDVLQALLAGVPVRAVARVVVLVVVARGPVPARLRVATVPERGVVDSPTV